MPAKANDLHAQAGGPDIKKVIQERNIQQLPIKLVVDNYTPQKTGPEPLTVKGQQQGLNTPPSGRERCYSSLPSKHVQQGDRGKCPEWAPEGFRVPPIPATPGRTELTPSARRSDGAELTGALTSRIGICPPRLLAISCPSGTFLRYVKYRHSPRVPCNFLEPFPKQLAPGHKLSGASTSVQTPHLVVGQMVTLHCPQSTNS